MSRGFKRRILWPTHDSEGDVKVSTSYAETQTNERAGSTYREIKINFRVILVALALVSNRAKSRELGYFDQEVDRDGSYPPP